MRLRTLSCTLSFAGLSLLASAVLLAQGQSGRPQFRAGVELLQLDVVVLDNKRQPVRALTAADFTYSTTASRHRFARSRRSSLRGRAQTTPSGPAT